MPNYASIIKITAA